MSIYYELILHAPEAHLFEVTLTINCPDPEGQVLWLPTWIPGSYLIREFSRHIVTIFAESEGRPINISKLDKYRWHIAPCLGVLKVHYTVYAFDCSVRGAYLDQTRGLVNGSAIFLAVAGQEQSECILAIKRPEEKAYENWEVATSLMPGKETQEWHFGLYTATNYDEFIDHPIAMGALTKVDFIACGIPHHIVLLGRHYADRERLQRDIGKICEAQIRFFGLPAPFNRYLFLILIVSQGYGGLEHRNASALICSQDDLPFSHDQETRPAYQEFLGLVSHEYFHAWNVKRIKPAAFAPYDLAQENYTRLLWAFEGVTSYYDDLFLVRVGLLSPQDYLDKLAHMLTQFHRCAGRKKQSLEEASFDAWIKFYRQDENSINTQVSYYIQGALVALCLDLLIRKESCHSLDTVMRALWQRYGLNFQTTGQGLGEQEWEQIAQEVTGQDLSYFFSQALRHTAEWPIFELLPQLLQAFGIEIQLRQQTGQHDKGGWLAKTGQTPATLGIRTCTENGLVKLTHVFDGSAAQIAGLSPGDILSSINRCRITDQNLDTVLKRYPLETEVEIHAFRQDELIVFHARLMPALNNTWGLRLVEGDFPIRHAWLNGKSDH